MNRILYVSLLLLCFSCAKEGLDGTTERHPVVIGVPDSELAKAGTLSVKLNAEMAAAVDAAQSAANQHSPAVATSGVAALDAVLAKIGASRFSRAIAYDAQWERIYNTTGLNRWYRVVFDPEVSLAAAGEAFSSVAGVATIEYTINPKLRRRMSVGAAKPLKEADLEQTPASRATATMNDPLLSQQWNFDCVADSKYSQKRAGADVNLVDAWKLCSGGSDIVVAVIDEPVQTNHPDLAANIWTNTIDPQTNGLHGYNFWNNKAELDWKTSYYDTDYRERFYADHGSHVAGVIAAVNNNGTGVSSIAGGDGSSNGVKIMSCQIMGYDESSYDDDADIKAFDYAMRHGAVIAQNSWGYNYDNLTPAQFESRYWNTTNSYYSQFRDAMNTFIAGAGTNNPNSPISGGLVIFAAGNDGDSYGDAKIYPGAYTPVIAVGSLDWGSRPAYYTDYGSWVDISAPGGDAYTGGGTSYQDPCQILSTILRDDTMTFEDGRASTPSTYGYGYMQGTSMACPHVSGVAALGLAYASQLGKKYTAEQFKALLLSSVSGVDSYFTGSKSQISNLSGYKSKMGGGCVDALRLLLAIKGAPAIFVKTGTATAINFKEYLGTTNGAVSILSATLTSPTNLGLSSANLTIGSAASTTITCPAVGTSLVTVSAKSGDTTFTREFAIISRPELAANGGWL